MSEAKKTGILRAAGRLCAEHGAGALRMDQVAAAAGVAKGTLYLYFSTKDALLAELAREELVNWTADVAKRIRSVREPGSRNLAHAIARAFDGTHLLSFLHSADAAVVAEALAEALPELDLPAATRLWTAIRALHAGFAERNSPDFEEALANQIRGAVRGRKNKKHSGKALL